jgi:hypothetical protein
MSEHIYLDHDTLEESLAAQLPEYMPKDPQSGNFKLLSTIAERLESLDSDVQSVNRATSVHHADSLAQLERLADLVGLTPYTDETREHFRARVLAEFQSISSQGTVRNVLDGIATMLDTDITNIRYTEEHTSAGGSARIEVPLQKLDSIAFDKSEFSNVIKELMPASYQINVLIRGTFTYISPAQYNDTSFVHNPDEGYDGLDTNGNPKGNGGTYAGIL